MKFLKSIWGVVLLGAIVNILTIAVWLYVKRDSLGPAGASTEVAATVGPGYMWSFESAEVDKLVVELKSQRKGLETRETDLAKLSGQVASEREELNKVRADVQAMRDQLTAAIVEVQDTEVKNIKVLSQTYSTMTPAAAVVIFGQMDEAMVVKILSMMKTDKVGAVFQEMGRVQGADATLAKRAARISDKLRLLKSTKKEGQKI